MKKNQLVIVADKDIPEETINKIKAEARAQYPDHEIVIVNDLKEWKKQQAQFGPEPIPFTRPKLEDLDLPNMPSIKEMKFNNPWPSHHHSSKRNRKY